MITLAFETKHRYANSGSGIEVPVMISADARRQIALPAKIDTGAEFCIFQREYGELLDLRAENGERKRFSTATGILETHGHFVTLCCLGYEFESKVFFAMEEGLPRNVLGLYGWLDRLRFGLVHYDRSLFLSHYDQEGS